MKIMKITDSTVTGTDIETVLTNPDWVLQQKFDGAHVMVVFENDEFLFTNDGEKPIAFSAAKLKLPALETDLRQVFKDAGITDAVIEGELIIETGIYWMFEAVELVFEPAMGSEPMSKRAEALVRLDILNVMTETDLVRIAPTARTELEKRVLWDRINEQGVEGAVAKHVYAAYEYGVRTKNQLKFKLVKSADVVVMSVDRKFDHKGMVTHGSADFGVYINPLDDLKPWLNAKGIRKSHDDLNTLQDRRKKSVSELGFAYVPRTLLSIGAASLIGKDLTIEPGDIVEIRYLNWSGGSPIQPAILRKRWDKPADECTINQFPSYSREGVSL